MDEVRLKDELMARLSNELDRPALQVIDGALSSVLRNYEISKRETGLSTNIISFPELDIFIGKIRFENYSVSTVNQYQRFLTDLLIYVGKPVQEIAERMWWNALIIMSRLERLAPAPKTTNGALQAPSLLFYMNEATSQKILCPPWTQSSM